MAFATSTPIDDLDIAVIGVGLRFPDADDVDAFWKNLAAGAESIRTLTDADLERAGVKPSEYRDPAYVRASSRLEGVRHFDAGFFGYSRREAELLDPQVRVLLECSSDAFEDAGYDIGRSTQPVGVFVAVAPTTYLVNNLRHQIDASRFILGDGNLQRYLSTVADFTATRVSYKLNLRGPSLAVQTACSGSLVAVHLARQSLHAGECAVALAGGVAILLPQDVGYLHRDGFMLSVDGRCRPFDAAASGTVFGRGAGTVVMKRLADAVADGDRIYAVIKGSAVNNDGASKVGYSAPSVTGQAEVIAEALANAGVTADSISYVEAHGTATAQGDPIEIAGLTQAFRSQTSRRQFCAIGSVKGNIGHLDAAAGMAGLIKTILALDREWLPASLHYEAPNPVIDFAGSPFYVNATGRTWPRSDAPRRAGVSAFGMGGTNAHVIVEEAPLVAAAPSAVERPAHVLALSAKTERALTALLGRYADAVELSATPLADLCFTANTGRAQHAHRAALVVTARRGLVEDLRTLVAGGAVAHASRGDAGSRPRPRVAMLFTGQGAQYAGMGRPLYDTQPTFRAALDRCAALLRPQMARPLLDLLYGADRTAIDQTAVTQPALFAIGYALTELWRSWGVQPDAVLGHSVGEYTAACVAGVLSLEDASRLVAERGRLMQSLPAGGAMAAVFADVAVVREALAPVADRASIAAVNGRDSIVISGDAAAVDLVCRQLAARGIESQPLTVSHAFHSPLMDPVVRTFEAAASRMAYHPPRLPLISNLTGAVAGGDDAVTARYWARHLREPVQFARGIETLDTLGCDVVLEIGPHPTLIGLARRFRPDAEVRWVASLRKGSDDWTPMLEAAGQLWTAGVPVDWAAFDRDYVRRRVSAPTYPFERTTYWIDAQTDAPLRAMPAAATREGFNGRRVASPRLRERVLEFELDATSPAFLTDHRLCGVPVLPMTAYLELALASAPAAASGVTNVTLDRALTLGPAPRVVQVLSTTEADGTATIEWVSADSDGAAAAEVTWTSHGAARISSSPASVPAAEPLAAIRSRCATERSGAEFYQELAAEGFEYGPAFRSIDRVWRRDGEALAAVRCPDPILDELDAYRAHPAWLDGLIQLVYAAFPEGLRSPATLHVPVALDAFTIAGSLREAAFSHATVQAVDGRAGVTLQVRVLDRDGRVVAAFEGLRLQAVARQLFAAGEDVAASRDWFYTVDWRAQPLPQPRRDGSGHLWLPDVLPSGDHDRLVDDARRTHGLDVYARLEAPLHALSTAFVVQSLLTLGWRPQVGQRVTLDALRQELGVVTQHTRMLERMLAMLVEDGVLVREGAGWEVRQPLPSPGTPADDADRLLRDVPACRAEVTMTARCGAGLADVLSGRRDPLELLFPGGSVDDLEALYRQAPFARATNALVRHAVADAIDALPEDATLRILEIGGGTGGTASWVIPTLPAQRSRYTFTDVSPLFLAKARQRFADHSFVSYRLLDIEQDPASQGMADERFDLVLATNVLHTTVDLQRTVNYARDLLAPGGALVMVEAVAPQRWIDVIFGLTDGWWRFADRDLREYPLLDLDRWRTVFDRAGFVSSNILPADERRGFFHQAVLVARRSGAHAGTDVAPNPERGRSHWLIVGDEAGVGGALLRTLAGAGEACTRMPVLPAEGAYASELRLIAAPADASLRVVYCAALGDHSGADASAADVARSQQTVVGGALGLLQALVRDTRWRSVGLALLTRGAQPVTGEPVAAPSQASLWGFGKVVALEHPEVRCRRVDLDPAGADDIESLRRELALDSIEDEVGFRGGRRFVPRLTRRQVGEPARSLDAPVRLTQPTPGALDSLALTPADRVAPGPDEVEIEVAAAGLNFKDVLKAVGVLQGGVGLAGLECAGRIVRVGRNVRDWRVGDDVVAMVPGSFGSHLTTHQQFVVRRPQALSVEQAATIPVAFVTAYEGLVEIGRMRAGDRVLIHAATGGVGMAALQLARRAGAEVFATAGSERKRQWLRDAGCTHVFDSRSTRFAEEISTLTRGGGVDIVLNTLGRPFLAASMSVLKPGGRFVELSKAGETDEPLAPPRDDVEYRTVDVGDAFDADPRRFTAMLDGLLGECAAGTLSPLPYRTFAGAEASEAFQVMSQARHLGKIVLRFGAVANAPRLFIRPDATYLVTGAFGGIGLLLARWLADAGATHLLLVGRSAPSPDAAAAVAALVARGTEVRVVEADVSDADAVGDLLAGAASWPAPLRGVFHAAGTVDDRMLVQQDWGRFERVMAAKVLGSWNLHQATRGLPLDSFVLFSTYVALLGASGQANHAAANACLDALASYRHGQGLPALSINWGPWSDIGAAVARGVTGRLESQGIHAVSPAEGMAAFEALFAGAMRRELPAQIAVLPMTWSTYLRQSPARDSGRLSAMAADVRQAVDGLVDVAAAPAGAVATGNIRAAVSQLAESARGPALLAFVRDQIGRSLGMQPDEVLDPSRPLAECGLDSLLAVEVRSRLGAALGQRLQATLLFDYPTLDALTAFLGREVLAIAPWVGAPAAAAPADVDALSSIEQLDDQAVERLLAARLAGGR